MRPRCGRATRRFEDLAGRLITAQEAERARIARDLHDDISQQLAAISIAISECKRPPELQGSGELLETLTAVQRQTIALPRTFACCHTTFTQACSSMRIWWRPCAATAVSSPGNSPSPWSSRPTTI